MGAYLETEPGASCGSPAFHMIAQVADAICELGHGSPRAAQQTKKKKLPRRGGWSMTKANLAVHVGQDAVEYMKRLEHPDEG